MAFRIFERYPGKGGKKGSAKSYFDPDTGQVLSATKYRDYKAEQEGYRGFRQRQQAKKKRITVSKTGLIQHHYELGLPKDLAQVVSDTIRGYDYEDSFAVGVRFIYVSDEEDEPQIHIFQSSLYPCLPMYISSALLDVRVTAARYLSIIILNYFVTVYPPKGAL